MWYVKNFNELDAVELEQILRLRQSIFILEQKVILKILMVMTQKQYIFNKTKT